MICIDVSILVLVESFLQYRRKTDERAYCCGVSILVLVESFLQSGDNSIRGCGQVVSILVLVESFLQYCANSLSRKPSNVSILVLVESFLQSHLAGFICDTVLLEFFSEADNCAVLPFKPLIIAVHLPSGV